MKRTFILCQEILYQIYAIHTLNNNHILPCVVILLPIINEDTYNRLFREVKDAVIRQGNEPTDILKDFARGSKHCYQSGTTTTGNES